MFIIGKHKIGNGCKPFIIAEMSGNHNQSLDKALEIVKAAADAGAHALKIQTYTADSLTINHRGGLFDINDESSLWKGRNLYELYQEAHTPYEWHEPIFSYAKQLGLVCFSTPFDEAAVDFLEQFDVPAYKIASFENNHYPLLKKVARTKKPVIMSTGISTLEDIELAVKTLRENGCDQLVLLKCTSTYPASPENSNLKTIPELSKMFNCEVGLSDHTMGIGTSIAAVALGASVIEKHFCLSRAAGGVDSAFSLEPAEMKMLVTETERAFLSLGNVYFGILKAEENSKRFKRSIYAVKDIKKGDIFSENNIRIIRPGDGLNPKYFESIIGTKAQTDIPYGTPLKMESIKR